MPDSVPAKLLFIVTADWYFCSHRLALARAAKQRGDDVLVATQVDDHGLQLTQAGIRVFPVVFPRSAGAPWHDLRLLLSLIKLCNAEKPDIIHNIALKPVLYGSLAAFFSRDKPRVINLLTGFGHVFSSRRMMARLLRLFIQPFLGFVLRAKRAHSVVQNPDDLALLRSRFGIPLSGVTEIPGSGVDLEEFSQEPEPDGPPLVLFPARLIADKGLFEFVEVARRLKQVLPDVRFVLAGALDPQNPSSLSTQQLEALQSDGIVEWWGWRKDMPAVFAQCHVVCLPSHREGLPKALIEAAAAGRAIVATDVPGCRSAVRHEVTGLLVPLGDLDALQQGITRLIEDGETRRKMGARGRTHAEQFSINQVVAKTLKLYDHQCTGIRT